MAQSPSLRIATATTVELSRVSRVHAQRLLSQLLEDANIPNAAIWQSTLLNVLFKATEDVDPDVQKGDDMDIRHYIKLKKIPGGDPDSTFHVDGLVFTKNFPLKWMPRSITSPRIILIGFALEYSRDNQQLMSLEGVMRQEHEYLSNLVNRIRLLEPTLLLVEKNVSGKTLDLLAEAGIPVAFNVKPSVMEAVSRCTGARIITSIDRMVSTEDPGGHSEFFKLRTYLHNGRKRTSMYVTGCPKELGCTIVLRGASRKTLVRIKRITEFMAYVVYNLKLEACVMLDQFAKTPLHPRPSSHSVVSSISSNSYEQPSTQNTTPSDDQQDEDPSLSGSPTANTSPESSEAPSEPNISEEMMNQLKTRIISASPFVRYPPPYLLTRSLELERKVANLKRLCDQDQAYVLAHSGGGKSAMEEFVLVTPDMVNESLPYSIADMPFPSSKAREILHAVHQAEYDRTLDHYQTLMKQWQNQLSENVNIFDPYSHGRLSVLYTVMNTKTSTPCIGPEAFMFRFYDQHPMDIDTYEADCTLGQYIEYVCGSAHRSCDAGACEDGMVDHHRRYVHGEASIQVLVKPWQSRLPGYDDRIVMWSHCKECDQETPITVMSKKTWKYSFGQYLELTFCSDPFYPRSNDCPHDLQKDHIRSFAYQGLVVQISHEPIVLMDVVMPRHKIMWKVEKDLELRNELYTTALDRLNSFIESVESRISAIHVEGVIPERVESCKQAIENLNQRAKEDKLALLHLHQEKYMNSKYWEIIPLSAMIRALQDKVVEWDNLFVEFQNNFFPSESDIKRLALLQLRRFIDKGVSVSPPGDNHDAHGLPDSEGSDNENMFPQEAQDIIALLQQDGNEKASDQGATRAISEPGNEIPPLEPSLGEESANTQHPEEDATHANRPDYQGPSTEQHRDEQPGEVEPEPVTQLKPIISPKKRVPRPKSSSAINEKPVSFLTPPSSTAQPRLLEPKSSYDRKNGDGVTKCEDDENPAFDTSSRPHQTNLISARGSGSGVPRISAIPGMNVRSRKPKLREPSSAIGSPSVDPVDVTSAATGSPPRFSILSSKPGSDFDRTHPSSIPAPTQANGQQSWTSRPSQTAMSQKFMLLSRQLELQLHKKQSRMSTTERGSRVYPIKSSNPTLEVYKNDRDAVERDPVIEREPVEDEVHAPLPHRSPQYTAATTPTSPTTTTTFESGRRAHPRRLTLGNVGIPTLRSRPRSASVQESRSNILEKESRLDPMEEEGESEDEQGTEEQSIPQDIPEEAATQETEPPNDPAAGGQSQYSNAQPQEGGEYSEEEHENERDQDREQEQSDVEGEEDTGTKPTKRRDRNPLVAMLASFWAERSANGWKNLEYPLRALDHVFADCDIIVREDEPSSLIAFTLNSEGYKHKLEAMIRGHREHDEKLDSEQNEQENDPQLHNRRRSQDSNSETESIALADLSKPEPGFDYDDKQDDEQVSGYLSKDLMATDFAVEDALLSPTGTHLKYQLEEGQAKMACKVFYAEHFDALRRKCGVSDRFVESLSRCSKNKNKGGKSQSIFLKTMDERFLLKSLSSIETQAFLKFAPGYFKIMSEVLFHQMPSCIAKMFGLYQVIIKDPATGVDFNRVLLLMENLFYDRTPNKIFDLKGSMRNRKVNGDDEVLLDENMVEYVFANPIITRAYAKRQYNQGIWNDTLFLVRQNVMDYSLMVAIDQTRSELVIGIIDCIRPFTWDKKVEWWIKDRGLAGGSKNMPTIVSPRAYKNRFRHAMAAYVLYSPDAWYHVQDMLMENQAKKKETDAKLVNPLS